MNARQSNARRRQRKHDSERGQASVLGIVALVVLAIGMYTSFTLSRSVYEKIALQNAADSAAYSLATQSARAFNFIAFSNRALVAKQIELLELHARVSESTYAVGIVGYLGDVVLTYSRYLSAIPATAQVGLILENIGDGLRSAYEVRSVELESLREALHAALLAEPRFSKLYSGMAAGLVASTAARLLEGAPDIVARNDRRAEPHALTETFNAYNVYTFLDSFDTDAFEKSRGARRAFAEIVNGSRVAAGTPRSLIVHRAGVLEEITAPLAKLAELTRLDSVVGNDDSGFAGRLNQLASGFSALEFVGTSKLLTRRGDFADLNDSGQSLPEHSLLAGGDVMVSKDMLTGMAALPALFKAASDGFASLQSTRDGHRYCRYEAPAAYGTGDVSRALRLLREPQTAGFTCGNDAGYSFRWRGIGRYFRFKSDPGSNALERDFNQPDVWVFLTKEPKRLTGVRDGEIVGSNMLEGINAIARAQVYYHRPGAWNEPPNLFNPYWGARLAPKSDASDRVLQRLGIHGPVARFFTDNTVMF